MNARSRQHLLSLSAMALLALAAGACVEEGEPRVRDLTGFQVDFIDPSPSAIGAPDAPLVFPLAYADEVGGCRESVIDEQGRQRSLCRTVALNIEARRPDNTRNEDFNGTVELRVVPGEIHPDDRLVQLVNGRAENHRVRLRFTFGRARIWVEDTGVNAEWFFDDVVGRMRANIIDECHDGIDNDGNGLIDFPADPGCDTDDTSEGGGTFTTGISDPLYFELPTIRSVQRNPDSESGPSPLAGQYVEVTGRPGHDLVVTNVTNQGFYVTDLADQSYNSIFVFNFSFPEDVNIGDRLCELGGGVTEFNAMTQLQFPSWAIQGKPRSSAEARLPNPEDEEDRLLDEKNLPVDCSWRYGLGEKQLSRTLELPHPVRLDATLIGNLAAMEKLEASLVTVENVQLSTTFINCDDNGSGRIEAQTAEAVCRTACNNNPLCTELSSLYGFDQWRGRIAGAEVSVSSSLIAAGFDVLAGCERSFNEDGRETYSCPARTLKRVTGTLRQVAPTCDRFLPCDPADESFVLHVIEPRFTTDIVE